MTTDTINSIGHTCQILQRPFGPVKKAAEQLKLTPVLYINGIAHFSDHQVETLRRHFAEADNAKR